MWNRHRLNIPLERDLVTAALFGCVTLRERASFSAILGVTNKDARWNTNESTETYTYSIAPNLSPALKVGRMF